MHVGGSHTVGFVTQSTCAWQRVLPLQVALAVSGPRLADDSARSVHRFAEGLRSSKSVVRVSRRPDVMGHERTFRNSCDSGVKEGRYG